jgi:hypothetical protein
MIRPIGIRLAFAIIILLPPAFAAAQNVPLTKAAVGDWVEFKGTVVSIFAGAQTHTMRYTVKAKTDKTATVTAKSLVGDAVESERDIEWPLDQPLDAVKLAAGGDDKVTVTFEKNIPELKYKIKDKEFQGTGYQYKLAIDLFRGLDIPEAEKAKPLETTVTYLVTPEAPVLGIGAFSMKGFINVKYELSDGTGVAALLDVKSEPKPR